MRAADKAFQLGLDMMEAARPDGHTWPRTESEWGGAVAALEQMGVAMYLKLGMPKAKARTLARVTHGGQAGRLLLATAQQADRERHE